jgi:hypothetical protein
VGGHALADADDLPGAGGRRARGSGPIQAGAAAGGEKDEGAHSGSSHEFEVGRFVNVAQPLSPVHMTSRVHRCGDRVGGDLRAAPADPGEQARIETAQAKQGIAALLGG